MKFIKAMCKKCSYEIEIPEKTVSYTCGSCGSVNYPGRMFSGLKKQADYGRADSSSREKEEAAYASHTNPYEQTMKQDDTDLLSDKDDFEFPKDRKVSGIFAIILIVSPFILMALDFFNLPAYTAIPVILLIIVIVLSRGK